jgi:flavin reductase (DIM6/NTAB) family NADH-FMN oxidoreductase RutF
MEVPMTPETTPDVRTDALRMLSNGVYVLTTCLEDTFHAASVTWVTQVSFQPPLLTVALKKNSRLADAVRRAHRFALNILDEGQQDLAEHFLQHFTAPAGSTSLGNVAFRTGPARCPLLVDSLGWLECRYAGEPSTPGDHCLVLAEVAGAGVRRDGRPMVLWTTPWSYGGVRAP